MKGFIICSIFLFKLFLIQSVSTSTDCDACLQGTCYTKTILWDKYNGSGGLDVDRNTNTLYLQVKNTNDEGSGYINVIYGLDDDTRDVIPNVPMIRTCIAVDQETRRVFIGTTRGLHEYNPLINKTVFLGLAGETIYDRMQFKNKLYYARLPYGLCTVDNNYMWECINAFRFVAVDDFVVDKNDDIYYRSGAKISRLANNSDTPQYLFTHRFAKLGVDINGEVYSVVTAVIEKLDYDTDQFVRIGSVSKSQMYDYTFEKNNNIIYTDIVNYPSKTIVRLIPTGENCS